MASGVAPSYSSMRVQKAYRLNGVEGVRLQWRLHILERQKLRSVQLVNQDIRLTKITLEHIHVSSGCSDNRGGARDDVANVRLADEPLFMYGERQVRRKTGRLRRVQSAAIDSKRKTVSSEHDAAVKRPQTAAAAFGEIKSRAERQLNLAAERSFSALPRPIENKITVPDPSNSASRFLTDQLLQSSKALTIHVKTPKLEVTANGQGRSNIVSRAPAPEGSNGRVDKIPKAKDGTQVENNNASLIGVSKEVNSSTDKAEKMNKAVNFFPTSAASRPVAGSKDRRSSQVLETLQVRAHSAPVLMRELSRSDQATAAVKKARLLSSRAKKYRNSIISDPMMDQTLPMAEAKRKRKEANFEINKSLQRLAEMNVSEKVREYLGKHPVNKDNTEQNEPSAAMDEVYELQLV